MAKRNRRAGALQPKRIAIAVSAAFLPWLSTEAVLADPAANQLPTGGNVAAGAASISVTGSKMQIDQASDKAIINWQNFSIGKDGWVNFSQPSSSSVALNRSLQPAEIFGRLSANGQVFVTSSAGVYFARTASVDVGGLVATNLSIRDQDFMAGRYVFSNEGSTGSVINDGTIVAVNGYAALAGTQVRNNGIIVAQAGTVALAAGDRVTLDMIGDGLVKVSVDAAALNALALNSGTIQADGGRVVLTARSANALLDTVINNTGVIRAKSLVERNGEIVLDGGSAGVVAHSGTLDASGGVGTTGGTVKASGQYVVLSEGSSIDASGNAGGGTVTVSATDAAFVYGSISARDTGGNGKGGTVETSGRYLEVTRAPDVGAGGTWLIDPYNIDVVADVPPPGFSNNTGPTAFTPSGDSSQIAASLITNQLNAGTNVILDTGGAGSPGTQAGDIRVQAGIETTAPNAASLTLKAFHDVEVNQPIRISSVFPGPTGFGTLTIDAGNNVVVSAPITTQGGGLNIRAGGFTNHSAINNGVGGDLKPGMAIFADRFDLAGGTINGGQGSVGLFTRTATNSLGVESAGDTRITNADIASITTSPDLPTTNANQLLIGVGSIGTMTIGADAQVDGGSKNLVFSAFGGPGTRVTIGANGVTTTGDLAVNATGGSIGGTGTIGGNRVQLTASTGIGTSTARVGTAVGTLAARTTSGSVFIAEADDVRLGAVTLAGQTVTNGVAPGNAYDLTAGGNVAIDGTVSVGGRLNLGAGGTLSLNAAGVQDSQLFSSGGQTISAAALSMNGQNSRRAVISNTGGNQALTIGAGGMNLNVVDGAGVAQIANNSGTGTQTIQTSGTLDVVGGSAGASTNSGVFQNQTGKQTVTAAGISLQGALVGSNGGAFISNTGGNGDQEINVAGGTISIAAGAVGLANRAFISSNGNQTINGDPNIVITGGSSGAGTAALNTSNGAGINTNGVGKVQTIHAGNITLNAGSGGNETFAVINGANQVITASGDVRITGGDGTGTVLARIGGIGGALPGPTNLMLNARDVVITGGSAAGGEAGLGSTAIGVSQPNTITVNATRDVILNPGAGSGARIGTALAFATPAGGDISVSAQSIQLNGTTQPTAIRTTGNVSLNAASISEGSNGFVIASALNTTSSGSTSLVGPNAITSFDGTSTGGNVSVTNTASLDIANVTTPGSASIAVTGNITESGSIQAASLATSSTGSTTLAGPNQIGTYTGSTTGPGSNMTLHNAGSLTIDGPVSSAGMLNLDVDGALTVSAVARDAIVTSRNGQTITADALTLHAQNGRRAVLQNIGGNQSITIGSGGMNLDVAAGAGVAQISNNAGIGTQTIETTGAIHVVGGSAAPSVNSGIFQNQTGKQTVTAANISLQGALTGNNGAALISNAGGGGDQEVNVAGGTIHIAGGAVGLGNRAGIVSNGNQTINGNPDIELTGGTSGGGTAVAGTSNGVFIAANGAGKTQAINAANLTLTGGTGGPDTFAIVTGANQQITALGDVLLAGGSGSQSAVRIGGIGGATPGPTNLVLTARDVILTGGNTAGSYASVGSTPLGASQDNNVTVNAGRDVILNAGIAGATIGTSLAFAAPAGGDIFIGAGRIELNGGANPAAIRTTGNVMLTTSGPGGISESSNGHVQAGSLSTSSSNGATNLAGPNLVGRFSALTMGGDLIFNNSGNLNLAQLTTLGNLLAPGNAAITNGGDVTVTGFATISGALTMNVAGAVKLDAQGVQDVFVTSNGQTINAQSLSVTSRDGRAALLRSNSGEQTISITGGSVDVLAPNGLAGFAQISSSGNQSIAVANGEHIAVNGGVISSGGNQTLSITGSGANRITVGVAGTPRGSVVVAGRNQTVTAGTDIENGAIMITGPAVAGTGISGFVTVSGVGADTQTVSTTGTLRVTGGTAPVQQPNINSGIFHNRQGQQTITAADIVVEGGPSGGNNGAFISTSGPNAAGPGGGDQVIHASGTITLRGSDAGFNNRASIFSNANQTIDGDPDITITAGSGGIANLGNTAGISTAAGRMQTIRAGTLELTSGAGGIDATAFISGGVQDIRTTGDLRVTGGGSGGTRGAALIGGPGGGAVLQPTILTLDVGRDLILTGGSATNDAASIGSSALGTGTPTNDITISVGRDVILNSGSGAGARIGTSVLVPPTDGHISITAGRNIELNGMAQPTVIRTAGSVDLHAGGTISEAGNGFVVASTLDTTSGGAQSLVGPNQVSRFTAAAASGDVTLRNSASVLTLGTMDLSGALTIDQTGALDVPGTVTALNQSIQATGDVSIGSPAGTGIAGLFADGTMSIRTPQSILLRGSDQTFGGASLVAAGGLVTLDAGDVRLTGGMAPLAAASVLGGELVVTTANNIALTSGSGWNADALLYSRSNITMTIGGILTIDGGHSAHNWARVQTEQRDGTITLNFPNAESGSFFVDGFEGKIKHGQDGFFTADKPAKLDRTLFINYGL